MAEDTNSTQESRDLESLYDQMFSYRYTDEDEDYKLTVSRLLVDPPCVPDYSTRPNRDFHHNRGGRGHRGQDRWRGRGQWQGHHRSRDSYGGGDQNHSPGHRGQHYERGREEHRYRPY